MSEEFKSPEYVGQERRQYQKTIHDVEAAFARAMVEHERRSRENVESAIEALKHDLVPNGDLRPHKDYHQAKVDAAKAEQEFWNAAKMKLVENGVGAILAVLKIVLGLALVGLMLKLGMKLPTSVL